MGLFFADLVRERSTATGTGDFALAGPLPGHRSFAEAVPAGTRFHYAIAGVTHPHEWETGEGEIGSDGLLRRDPIASSAGGDAVDFTAGLKTVALTVSAAWFAAQEEAEVPSGALASLEGAADRVAYFTGADSAALTPLGGFGRALIGSDDAAAARARLGLTDEPAFAGHLRAGSISAGTDLSIGAITASGGKNFSELPPYGTASIGLIHHSSGWNGSGFLFTNTSLGTNAFSLVCNNDTAFFGFIGPNVSVIPLTITDSAAKFYEVVTLDRAGMSVDDVPVVGRRRRGWQAPGGTAVRASFDTDSVTTAELARRVKALIDDLTAHGLIGA